MKKYLTIIALAALTLASCGGNTNQNNGTDGRDGVHTVSTPESASQKVELTPELLKQMLQQAVPDKNIDMEEAEINGNHIQHNSVFAGELRELSAYRIDDASFKVFYAFNAYSSNFAVMSDDDFWYTIKEYVYKDGKLTETTLQTELNGEFGQSANFSGDTLKFSDDKNDKSTIFVWNGQKMEKK